MPGGSERLANKVRSITGAASVLAEAVADRLASEGATAFTVPSG
jgi:NADP-dependent 3-hydroxy acid dehydrogenase YdfG